MVSKKGLTLKVFGITTRQHAKDRVKTWLDPFVFTSVASFDFTLVGGTVWWVGHPQSTVEKDPQSNDGYERKRP